MIVDGATFVLDAPTDVPAVWGHGTDVLWAKGEALLLCGSPGVGKSTLIQQVVRARIGLGDAELLGLPVEVDPRPVLYVAADRSAQIARSLRRMFTAADRDVLAARLVVEKAPAWQLVSEPGKLRALAQEHGAGTVIVDSLKDVASPLSDEATGTAVKRALAACTEAGIEVAVLHHQRKASGENKKPTKLDDVYGSAWITAGAGSVVLLHGEAGDPLVELLHLKHPAEEVGPFDCEHDHHAGVSTRARTPTVDELLRDAGPGGLAAPNAAGAVYRGKPTKAQVQKVRRRLDRLADEGKAHKLPSENPHTEPDLYVVTAAAYGDTQREERVDPRGPQRGPTTPSARQATNPDEQGPREVHAGPRGLQALPNPRRGEGVEVPVDVDVPTLAAVAEQWRHGGESR